MSWRLQIRHRTKYQYQDDVVASFNEAKMVALSDQRQTLLKHTFVTRPMATIFSYEDYWGTTVEAFELAEEHLDLEIISENLVDISIKTIEPIEITWELLATPAFVDEMAEFLSLTPLVDPIPELYFHSAEGPLVTTSEICTYVNGQVNYKSGVTNVHTKASEAWALKQGVCQDYTHITLSLLRSAGIPARYVSGYLYHGTGDIGASSVGESHSWIEAWVGDWVAFDPTNGRPVDQTHIKVAHGRDYTDVAPLTGIYSGGASRKIEVEVVITRMA
jgi:transglutaminase-like putative cysteine protease